MGGVEGLGMTWRRVRMGWEGGVMVGWNEVGVMGWWKMEMGWLGVK